MPIVRNVTGGTQPISAAKVARQFQFTVGAGTSSATGVAELQVTMLPMHTWYCVVTAGPIGCTITPMVAVTNVVVAGVARPDFRPLTAPQLLVAGTPFFFSTFFAANAISVIIACPKGGADATATVMLTSSV